MLSYFNVQIFFLKHLYVSHKILHKIQGLEGCFGFDSKASNEY